MQLPRPRPLPPAVPAAALADLTLLLVFFFRLSTSVDVDRTPVDLPAAALASEAAPGAACLTIERQVDATAGETLTWRFSDGTGPAEELPGPEALFFAVSRIVDDDPERTFLLRIDSAVRYAVVDDVLETLRRSGARNVVFSARVGTGGA